LIDSEHFTLHLPEPTMGHDPVGICTIFFWNIQCSNKLPQDNYVRDHLICTRLWKKGSSSVYKVLK